MSVLLVQGDARQIPLRDGSVHVCCTSPPYWGLRSYGIGAEQGELGSEPLHDCLAWARQEAPCAACWVCSMRAVFREVKRVLRDEGVLFINCGDAYHEKSLLGLPWRLALALQSDGLILRSEIIWEKPSCMPECLDPSTQVFIRQGTWVSRMTLGQLALLPTLPEILGPHGWVKIRHLWHTVKPAMALEAGKVEYVICSPEHRFPISSDRRRERITEKEAQDIRHEGYADYFLYAPIGRFLAPSIQTWMGQPLTPALGYALGVYAAEGGHSGERGFSIKMTRGSHEDTFATELRTALSKCGLDASETIDPTKSSWNFLVTAEWFSRTVDTFVFGQARTKALNIELLLNCPHDFRAALLQGYVDGDGSDRAGGGWSATSASKRLRDDIATLASSVGIITSKGSRTYQDPRTGTTSSAHALWTPYMTKRKSKSGLEGIFQIPPRRRRMLEGMREMIDIQVEGGLFLIGDGLVSHNSVQDRFTRSHEQVFLFAKQARYYFDATAVRESAADWGLRDRTFGKFHTEDLRANGQPPHRGMHHSNFARTGRNARTVWRINPEPLTGFQHYAAFPTALVRKCLLAGAPQAVCRDCGAPWQRQVERHQVDDPKCERRSPRPWTANDLNVKALTGNMAHGNIRWSTSTTIGFSPTCQCGAPGDGKAVIFDPFVGSGTVPLVARELGHHGIGLDLSGSYLRDIARERLGLAALHRWSHGAATLAESYADLPLFGG